MKHLLLLLLPALLLAPGKVLPQSDIETKLVLADTVNYQFTSEWQYLSTDIFLFNTNKFDQIINELNFYEIGRKRKPKTNTNEKIEFLFVSAGIKNVKLFNGSELVYPLYNFQVNRDTDKKYHTYVNENIDHIRIIDNLPIYSAGNSIDADIRVQAITNNNSDLVLSIIGKQLQTIALSGVPSLAALSIVGELGNFLESNTKKREYRFKNTIRLYEQENFDTRLHSVKVFMLQTQNSKPFNFNDTLIKNYLDTVANPKINRALLKQLIPEQNYPYLVVLNYRSMYQMNKITGDEITQEAVDERRARVLIDYKNGLITEDTYKHERDFIRFLSAFVDFKNSIELYNLNRNSGHNDASKKSLPMVIARYNNLLMVNNEMKNKYTGNPVYKSVFVGEYDDIIAFAQLYLDNDPNLRNAKELVHTLKELENCNVNMLDSVQTEKKLAQLNTATLIGPEFIAKTADGVKASEYIQLLEKHCYNSFFKPTHINLANMPYSQSSEQLARQIKKEAAYTNCNLCKSESAITIEQYNQKIYELKLKHAINIKDSLITSIADSMLSYVTMAKCLRENLGKIGEQGNLPVTYDFLRHQQQQLQIYLSSISQNIKTNFTELSLAEVEKFNETLTREAQLAQRIFEFFYRNKPCYLNCNCPETNTITQPTPDTAKTIKTIATDSLVSAVNKQVEQFRLLDITIYSSINKTGTDSLYIQKQTLIEQNQKIIEHLDKIVQQIEPELPIDNYNKLLKTIEQTVNQIGNNFNNYCVMFPNDCIKP